MIDIKEIYWLAGLLEGEGHFGNVGVGRRYLAVQLAMTDRDVVERAGRLLRARVHLSKAHGVGKKPVWRMTIGGHRAAGWMLLLYSLLSSRKKGQIRIALANWRAHPASRVRRCKGDTQWDHPMMLQ